ncbi:hypothetical protein [Methanopyrus sp. SNP6]|uniref:hypothetical protein n=1 Tax=Methanopyrus sp. SNP6 TaxID=1937005 RepID=UPI0011E5FF17|nr:hypothetical protein [Methanopyrus sp. SNP6]
MLAVVAIITSLAIMTGPVYAEVHVLTWAGDGADSTCVAKTKKIVDWWNTYRATGPDTTIVWHYTKNKDRWRTVLETGNDPLTGARISVVYVPGGWHPERYWNFDWVRALYHAQIDLGIGYVGICAGAYLHAGDVAYSTNGPGHGDVLQDGVTVIDGMNGPDRICRVLILPGNPLTPEWTWGNVFTYKYWNGPGFGPEPGLEFNTSYKCWVKITNIEGREVMIKIWPVGEYVDTCKGWAIVAGQYFVKEGNKWVPRGRFVLFGPHPELTSRTGAHALLAKAILWAAGAKVPMEPNPSPVVQVIPKGTIPKTLVAAVVSTVLTFALPDDVKEELFEASDPSIQEIFKTISNVIRDELGLKVPPEDLLTATVATVVVYVIEALIEWLFGTAPVPASA